MAFWWGRPPRRRIPSISRPRRAERRTFGSPSCIRMEATNRKRYRSRSNSPAEASELPVERHHEVGEALVGDAADDERLARAGESENDRVGFYRCKTIRNVADVEIDIEFVARERRIDRIRHLAHVRALRGRGEYFLFRIYVQADMLVVARKDARLAQRLGEVVLEDGRLGRERLRYDVFIIREGAVHHARDEANTIGRDRELRFISREPHLLAGGALENVCELKRVLERNEQFRLSRYFPGDYFFREAERVGRDTRKPVSTGPHIYAPELRTYH